MPATILLEDLQRANSDELNQHVNGLFGPPTPPGGDFDPSNILPRQIPVEAPPAPVPPQELQDHVQTLLSNGGAPAPPTPTPTPTPTPSPAPAPSPTPAPSGNVVQQLADHVSQATGLKWIGEGITNLQQGAQQATSGLTNLLAPAPAPTPATTAPAPGAAPDVNAPQGPLVDYARQAATKAGIDPNVFVRQIQQESGFNAGARNPSGATGIAQFMPGTAQSMGIDPNDPYQALDGAARLMKSHLDQYGGDYAKALAAYNAGPGNVAKYGGVPPFEETQRYINTILGGTSGQTAPTPAQGLERVGAAIGGANRDISQFGDAQLTNSQAYAACGPAAAVRFAQRFGRNPTLKEAVDLASTVGWTEEQGMAGLSSEKALMDKMGVATKMVSGADWGTFANEARTGNPVTISTRGHYFTADGWDPATNRFHVGRSGLDLKGGSEWMTPEQMTGLMGPVQGGLLADNPQAPSSTVQVAGVQSEPSAAPAARQGIQFLGDEGQTAAGFTAPGGPSKGFLEQAAGAVGEGFSRLGETVQGGLTILDNAIDSSAATPNPTPASVPGGGYDPSTLRAEPTPPEPGVPLRQDVRDLAQQPQPTLLEPGGPVGQALGQIGELPGLSEADRAARRQAIAETPIGQAYQSDIRKELLPNISEPNHPLNVMSELQAKYGALPREEDMTPEDAKRWQNAQLFIGGMAGPVGAAEGVTSKAGRAIDYDALANLRRSQRAQQPGLPDMPAAEPNLADRAIAFGINNMLSNPASMVGNAISGGIETVKRPVITALSGDLGAAGSDLRAMGLAVGDALADAGQTFATGRRASQVIDQPEAFAGKAGIVATPFLRTMGATDEFLRSVNAAGAQAAELVRLKRANPDLTQSELLDRFGDQILGAGQRASAAAVFESGGTGIGQTLAGARRQLTAPDATPAQRLGGAALNVLVPFSVIPDAILTRGARNLPLVNEAMGLGRLARGDVRGAADAGRRAALAETTNAAIWSQVLAGNVTGNGPDDPAKKRALMQARDEQGNPLWRPNSLRVGGQWVPYASLLGPAAVQVAFVANAVEQYEDSGRQVNPDVVKAFGSALGDTISDAWYLQTLSGAFSGIKNGTLPEWMTQQGLATAGRAIPEAGLLNAVRGITDPVQREGRPKLDDPGTWADYFGNRVPGVSPLVPPRVDPATGRPLQEPRDLGSLALRATAPGEPNRVNEILARHNLGVGDAPDTISPSKGLTVPLINEDEKRRFLELSGPEVERFVVAVSDKPSFQSAPPDVQRDVLEGLIGDAREIAAAKMAQEMGRDELLRRMQRYEAAQKAQAQPSVRLP